MAEYATPGVYVEEVPAAVKPIAGVGTSTAGFIGIVAYSEVDPTVEALTNRTLHEALVLHFQVGSGQKLSEDLITRIKTQFSNANTMVEVTRNSQLTALKPGMRLAEGIANIQNGTSLTDDLVNQIKQQFPDPNKTVKVKVDGTEQNKKLAELQPGMALAETLAEVSGATQDAPLDEALINRIKQQFPDPNRTVRVTETINLARLDANTTLDARTELQVPKSKGQPITQDLAYLINESSKTWETAKKVKVEPLTNPGQAKLCTNFGEFTRAFGGFSATHTWQNWLAHAVYGFFNNGGTRCWVTRADTHFFPSGTHVTEESVKEILETLRDRQKVKVTISDPVKTTPQPSPIEVESKQQDLAEKWLAEDVLDNSKLSVALDAFKPIDEIALVAIPGAIEQAVHLALIDHCENPHLQDRFVILDGKCIPSTTSPTKPDISSGVRNSSYGALYFPWITVADPTSTGKTIPVPPSGHIAGMYARVDTTRGVHKAPANEVIRGALDVERLVSKRQQAGLNPDGINVLRKFDGNIMVWGARTWAKEAEAEWRYINVRRLFLYLRKSIDQGTQWVVFEPNDPGLWAKIQRNVTAFLTNVWRAGALFGATPQEAFYVKCDAETNPPELRDLGRVVTEIGVAVVKPAEFVVFRVSQWAGPES